MAAASLDRRWAASVAAYGLLGSSAALPGQPVSEREFRELLGECEQHRLLGLLNAAVLDGAMPVSVTQERELSDRVTAALCGCLTLESMLLDCVDALQSRGIDYRVLKGSASAHLDYADPAQRVFGDVDLLIRAEAWDEAIAALTAAGLVRPVPPPRPGFDRRFGKGATLRAGDGREVDVHRTFVMGPFGLTVDLDQLWQGGTAFALAGRQIAALDVERRLLLACYNVALSDNQPRLSQLRDIAQLVLRPHLDVAAARALAASWRAEAVLARGIATTWSALQLADATRLSAWACRHVPDDPWTLRALAAYGNGASYATKSWASLRALPRWRDKAAFAVALAFPAGGQLGGRRRSLGSRIRAALRGRRTPGRG